MQNKTVKVFAIIDAVALVGVAMATMLGMYYASLNADRPLFLYIMEVLRMALCVFALYYIFAGCKKGEGSRQYKLFMNFFALINLITLVKHQKYDTLTVLLFAIMFGALTVLSVTADLGEKKSKILALVVSLCAAVRMLMLLLAATGDTLSSIAFVTDFVLALTCLVMVCAKYADKKARGSK